MKKIKEICAGIVEEMGIVPAIEGVSRPNTLKLQEVLDEKVWKESALICVAARPSMGKTAFALDIAIEAALCLDKPIVIYSLEMSEKQMVYRIIRKISGVNCQDSFGNTDINKIASAIDFLQELNIFIDDTPGISVTEIQKTLSSLEDVGLVLIDYIQLMWDETKRFRTHIEEVCQIIDDLSSISKREQLPIMFFSQLMRDVDRRENRRPELNDLYRLYPNIAEVVDGIIFLYRESFYSEDLNDDSAEIIIAKNPLGDTRTLKIRFDRGRVSFVK